MSKHIDKPLILIGTGGAGKTSIGKLLAKQVGQSFFDVDQIIVEKEGRSIPDIFEAEGEPYFRALEKETTIKTIKENPNAVISIGGGAFAQDEIREFILNNAVSVFLKADIDVLLKRVGDGAGRPMLKNNPKETLQALINDRYPIYEQADYTVESKDEPLEETAQRVIATIQ